MVKTAQAKLNVKGGLRGVIIPTHVGAGEKTILIWGLCKPPVTPLSFKKGGLVIRKLQNHESHVVTLWDDCPEAFSLEQLSHVLDFVFLVEGNCSI